MPLNMSSAKWQPFCIGLNVLIPSIVAGLLYIYIDKKNSTKLAFMTIAAHNYNMYCAIS